MITVSRQWAVGSRQPIDHSRFTIDHSPLTLPTQSFDTIFYAERKRISFGLLEIALISGNFKKKFL